MLRHENRERNTGLISAGCGKSESGNYIDFELSLGRMGWKDPSMGLIIRHDGKIITEISIRYDEVSM